jgi:hypothetical protein
VGPTTGLEAVQKIKFLPCREFSLYLGIPLVTIQLENDVFFFLISITTLDSTDSITKMAVLYFRHQIEFKFWSDGFDMKRVHVKQATVKTTLGRAFIHAYRFCPASHLSNYLIIAELCLPINGPILMD